jgi:DNA repair exonuclease SbcCD ATPase subunit
VVKNTLQGIAANNRVHNCDICSGLNKDVAALKSSVMGIVKDIRLAAEGLFASAEANPMVEEAKQTIAALKAKAKLVQKEIQPIVDEIKAYQQYIKDLQELIAYILTLPEELQKVFASCLAEATGSLKDALFVSADLTDQTEALTAAKAEIQSAIDLKTDVASGNTSSVIPQLS